MLHQCDSDRNSVGDQVNGPIHVSRAARLGLDRTELTTSNQLPIKEVSAVQDSNPRPSD